ncbi:hypothetical protein [Eggerthella sinensis]|uniref:hypothetical protein n=1 Tax=Eggerthella sinensis TaxID=242230 RepID=UPI0022E13347|nr:hypothetical protein [Eggerthella sinensis]
MAISTEIVGKEFGPFVREYTFKDLEICALGCNAGYDGVTDLEYVNERDAEHPDLKVLPIFGVPLTVHEEMTRTLDYGYNYDGSLHYGFEIKLHAPFKMNDRIETFVTQDACTTAARAAGASRSRRAAPTPPTARFCARPRRGTCASTTAAGAARSPRRTSSRCPTAPPTPWSRRPCRSTCRSSTASWATGISSTSTSPIPSRRASSAPSRTA